MSEPSEQAMKDAGLLWHLLCVSDGAGVSKEGLHTMLAEALEKATEMERERCIRLAQHADSMVYPKPRDALLSAIADMRECVCPDQCPRHGPATEKP